MGLTFLPDGTALVSERDSGRVFAGRRGNGVREVGRVEEARPEGEAGLLGLAVSPSYDEDRLVFAYVDRQRGQPRRPDDVRRSAGSASSSRSSPASRTAFIHDGGRLVFGPDGILFVSTGETGEPDLAQDPDSLGGKILRITPDGDPAPGNPVRGSPVWTMGHRNVQGLAFDDDGQLWASEFGAEHAGTSSTSSRGAATTAGRCVEGKGDEPGSTATRTSPGRPPRRRPPGSRSSTGRLWLAALRGERLWRVAT